MEERVFFDESDVYISNARFIVDDQTYAMSNVTSITSGHVETATLTSNLSAILGLIVLIIGINGENDFILFGIGLLGFGVYQFFREPEYAVILNSSSGETRALVSPNKEFVFDVIDKLNEAIVSRG